MKQILLLVFGVGLVILPFAIEIPNMFVAILIATIGVMCLSQLRGKPKIEYLGTRTRKTHVWGIKKK